MRIRRSKVVCIMALSVLLVAGAWAQEVPESPDPAESPGTPEATDTPEVQEAPDAQEAADAQQTQDAEETTETEETPEAPAAAPSLVFETTVDFEFVKHMTLEGKAGEVEIRGVEFSATSGKGGLLSSADADLQAGIVTSLECSTTADKKQKLDLVFQFLDGEGALIDRVKNGVSLKNGTKTFETSLKTLKYVVPLIAQVRITASATGTN